jgi:hypothetical protein
MNSKGMIFSSLFQENVRPVFGGSNVDSARQNLASSFVNGFVNAGFGQVGAHLVRTIKP